MTSSEPPWHMNALGAATEPLVYFAALIVTICVLTGKWWILGYLLAILVIYSVALMYALYLEYNAQKELERRQKARMNVGPKWARNR